MMMSTKDRARANCKIGPGGYRCPCCDDAPKHKRVNRRKVRRNERREWRKDYGL